MSLQTVKAMHRELLDEIRKDLGDEIHTDSVAEMARWLSPRCRLLPSEEFKYLIGEPVVHNALRKITLPRRPREW